MADKKNPEEVAEPTPGVGDAEINATEGSDVDDVVDTPVVDNDDTPESLSSETETETELDVLEEATAEVSVDTPDEAPVQVERIIEKRGGFFPTLLGGVVAAGIGFGLAQTNALGSIVGGGSDRIDALESAQSEIKTTVGEIGSHVDSIVIPDLDPLSVRVDALEGWTNDVSTASVDLAPIEAKLAELEAQLASLQARPVTSAASPEATAAFEAEMAKLQESFAQQRSDVEAMFQEARALEEASAAAAKIASAQTVLARLRAALDAGQPFGGMIQELSALGIDVPADLADRSADGVLTLSALTEGFAPSARQALATVREEDKAGASLLDYVNRQLGARSVAPREGDGTDAVLSRVEAAIRSGDLQATLSETSTLPEAAASAMADWIAAVVARQQTLTAAETLSQSLNAN